jgi:hypothetical protein
MMHSNQRQATAAQLLAGIFIRSFLETIRCDWTNQMDMTPFPEDVFVTPVDAFIWSLLHTFSFFVVVLSSFKYE